MNQPPTWVWIESGLRLAGGRSCLNGRPLVWTASSKSKDRKFKQPVGSRVRIGSSSSLLAAASHGHALVRSIHSASDKGHSVDLDVCALIAGAFYTGIMLLDTAFWHTPTLLQGRLAAQLSIKHPCRHPVSPAQWEEPAWEDRGKREFSGLCPADLWRQRSSSERHSEGKPEHQIRIPGS